MRRLFPILVLCAAGFAAPTDSILDPAQFVAPTKQAIRAYSEFMPAPALGVLPYEPRLDSKATLSASPRWRALFPTQGSFAVSIIDEKTKLRPALEHLAKHWLDDVKQLAEGETPGGNKLGGLSAELPKGNPYWPTALPKEVGVIVSLTPLTLSKAQDMDGKNPWTVYGGADAVPGADAESIFWLSVKGRSVSWLSYLYRTAFKLSLADEVGDLKKAGVRILSDSAPAELQSLLLKPGKEGEVKHLFTFQPYLAWDPSLKNAFADGKISVVPHPMTLVFAGSSLGKQLSQTNPEGAELALAEEFSQFPSNHGAQVLKVRPLTSDETWHRLRHRFSKEKRKDANGEDTNSVKLSPFQLIFDALPEVVGLYGKPVARNTQVWGIGGTKKGQWILNGPQADKERIQKAREIVDEDKRGFHSRDYFEPMRVNGHELRWYRPLVAWKAKTGNVKVRPELLGGVRAAKGAQVTWLTPVLDDRFGVEEEIVAKAGISKDEPQPAAFDGLKMLELAELFGGNITEEVASSLVTSTYPARMEPPGYAAWSASQKGLTPELVRAVASKVKGKSKAVSPLTFERSVTQTYEAEYWDKIAKLAHGEYQTKNNIDCADHEKKDSHCEKNDLPVLAQDYLTRYYAGLGLKSYAHVFPWVVDFPIPWWGGLMLNPQGKKLTGEETQAAHKNLVVVIPGENHAEAVIMGDHYDTAFMADIYEGTLDKGLEGHRHASAGADDNHSGTAALMEAARVLSRIKLKRDVWLVHLTGEEFPADCLGARALSDFLITGKQIIPGQPNPKIVGLYVLDMVAHNTDRDHVAKGAYSPSIFQISPGRGARSARLAELAHRVTLAWNAGAGTEGNGWNKKFGRKPGWERSLTKKAPRQGLFPKFRGEIRPWWHYRSSLFNTDGQIFSDAGIPAVLFMENYDINREGYHDTKDTLANIDLDYGAGVSRIAIESVAQAANE